MSFIYLLAIKCYLLAIRIAAFSGNTKAKQYIAGRKDWRNKLKSSIDSSSEFIWFHCASLGEFEQGKPVLGRVKEVYPGCKTLLTFSSPSGFENKKDSGAADVIFYLPTDSPSNASDFLNIVQPLAVIFVKYEFWHFYIEELRKRKIPLYLISAIFRPQQWFFKSYGSFFRNILHSVEHFFVQDQSSVDLIASIGIHSCTLSGDTRFDRVAERAETPRSFPEIAQLKNGRKTMVAGSTWTADERLILDSGCFSDEKNLLVLVPHETSERAIELLMSKAGSKAIRFSHWDKKDLHFNILVIDLIGMLSSLYQYADVTYVGGGFGAGIHNTLEAVAFGAPVIFGPNYEKFREAKELIESGGGFCINNQNEFKDIFEKLMSDENLRKQISLLNKDYIRKKSGATEKIISFLKHHRS